MTNTLQKICDDKREHIKQRKAVLPESELLEKLKRIPSPRRFSEALRQTVLARKPALIAEIKKASPSKGIIRRDFDPPSLAVAYESGGASCLSVLTDIPYFQGEDSFLAAARNACELPALRKDFMLEPYQILESRLLGADAILLIMAALSDAQAKELEATAHDLGMDVLVEVHDEEELERALALSSRLLGVNNRNLKTLEVDLKTGERLVKLIPEDHLRICESGIFTHRDLQRMRRAGYDAFLVGESLMREADVAHATRMLLEGPHT